MLLELQPNEQILATFRKHHIILFQKLAPVLAIAFVALFIIATPLASKISTGGGVIFFGSIILLFALAYAFVVWTKFYFDVWIVTTIRLVDIDQIALFNRKTSTLELENIEDITVKVEGLLQSMVSYGTLSVQTAGHIQEFIISDISDPEAAKQVLYTAQRVLKDEEKNMRMGGMTDSDNKEQNTQ